MPVTETAAARQLSAPCYPVMIDTDVDRVITGMRRLVLTGRLCGPARAHVRSRTGRTERRREGMGARSPVLGRLGPGPVP
ncbi:hypothetical protein [Streptomyces pseudogriseolus]|uniref:hypothetical protein n=1 Tax=Streptomyces pseudogriseolus TaxID=36817 RepID=UPI003474A8B5